MENKVCLVGIQFKNNENILHCIYFMCLKQIDQIHEIFIHANHDSQRKL